ncbi:DUF3993 domain-containing protein [Priestia taiwanensis]|nr:DUF3993 domain-containing protein [Priestia taiwanensis]MBM7363059.1 hypothetical protein [Priestia taiwanensis]
MERKAIPLLAGILLLIFVFAFVSFSEAQEGTTINRDEALKVVKSGIAAEKEVVKKKLDVANAEKALSPHLTSTSLQAFLDDNIPQSDSKSYSRDNLMNYTPDFSYDNKTKAVYDKEHGLVYVYEQIKGKYYVIMLMKERDMWKITGYNVNTKLLPEIERLQEYGAVLK